MDALSGKRHAAPSTPFIMAPYAFSTIDALFGVHAADLLSDGWPCEGFRDTLEDDRA